MWLKGLSMMKSFYVWGFPDNCSRFVQTLMTLIVPEMKGAMQTVWKLRNLSWFSNTHLFLFFFLKCSPALDIKITLQLQTSKFIPMFSVLWAICGCTVCVNSTFVTISGFFKWLVISVKSQKTVTAEICKN